MIILRFIHDTPHDKFEGTYRLALELYSPFDVCVHCDTETGHIFIGISSMLHTVEEVENDLAKYSHWFTAEESE